MSGPSRVLFACSHNAGRSQMAATLLAHRAGERDIRDAVDAHITELLTRLNQLD
ncbi:hypothetical protein [Streptomyces sp. NRRL S-237]|uniref:hypothetical protein n=1 Tax=Streptomyces sp. NRRL S-237 TaxID=1463895 RepID=UPI001F3D93DD|nr:hypothetical protein [Streptomyces sp. NRRL S-237]